MNTTPSFPMPSRSILERVNSFLTDREAGAVVCTSHKSKACYSLYLKTAPALQTTYEKLQTWFHLSSPHLGMQELEMAYDYNGMQRVAEIFDCSLRQALAPRLPALRCPRITIMPRNDYVLCLFYDQESELRAQATYKIGLNHPGASDTDVEESSED